MNHRRWYFRMQEAGATVDIGHVQSLLTPLATKPHAARGHRAWPRPRLQITEVCVVWLDRNPSGTRCIEEDQPLGMRVVRRPDIDARQVRQVWTEPSGKAPGNCPTSQKVLR